MASRSPAELLKRVRVGLELILMLLLPMLYSPAVCLWMLRCAILAGGFEFAWAFRASASWRLGVAWALVWVVPSLYFVAEAMRLFGNFVMLELLWLVLVYSDSFQLLVGRRFGSHKAWMVDRISPNKTVEGYAGGLLITLVLGTLVHRWPAALLVVVLLGGVLGDLAFSAAKRAAAVKDYSSLLGPHGGICDRIDSYVGAAHALFWFTRFFPASQQQLIDSRGGLVVGETAAQ
jgi:CDP-diglyceride synthetase